MSDSRPRCGVVVRFVGAVAALVFFLAAHNAFAAPGPLDPSSGAASEGRERPLVWRVRAGVVHDCGQVDLDEEGFVPLESHERAGAQSAAACYRATLDEDDAWAGQPIALSLGSLYATAAVYVNGVLIESRGDVETGHGARLVRMAYPIPEGVRQKDKRLTIAVITHITPSAYWAGISVPFGGTQVVGPVPWVEADVRSDEDSLAVLVGRMVVAALFALLGAFHLVLFRKRRKLTEYLYWALGMLSFSGWESYVVLIDATGLPRDVLEHFTALGYAVVSFALAGTWRLLRDDPMPRFIRALLVLNAALGIPQLLAIEAFGRVVPYTLVMLVLLGGALTILVVTVRWQAAVETWRRAS